MATAANFATLYIRKHLGDRKKDIKNDQGFEFVQDQTDTYNFNIEQNPVGGRLFHYHGLWCAGQMA